MATKPVAWHEQSPVSSLDKQVTESWVQGATTSHGSPLLDKKAPRAEPEEDIDDETLQENQTISRTEIADATKLENQVSTPPRETQEVVTELEQVPKKLSEASQAQEGSEKPADVCGDDFPPPIPPLSALSIGESCERDSFSALESEVTEWITDVEIISDPVEDLMSPDKEWAQATQLTEQVSQDLDSTSESDEMPGDDVTTEQKNAQLHFLPDGCDNSGANDASGAAHHSPSDGNSLDGVYAVSSPPFADECEEEGEVNMGITSNVSTEPDPTSALPAAPSAEQQEEPLPQSQCGLAPKGANQEAAQQVQGQGSPPLSPVAMELSNQGGAASRGFGCAVAVREKHTEAEGWTEVESEQTGGEEGQTERGHERGSSGGAAGEQHDRGLLSYSDSAQTQEHKTEKHSRGVSFKHSQPDRMESDSCDDSQSDSGVSTDFSPCSTSEGNTTISVGTPATVPKETPIEREIRRAVEREHSLRKSRGLPNPPTSPEYVEVPLRKSLLCQSLTPKSEKCEGKDRQFAGKKMQHEIHEETQREQDLVKLGKVPGYYDKGTVRQLKERKQLFEAFQKPSNSTPTISARSKSASFSSASDTSTLENQGDDSSQASTIGDLSVERRQSYDLLRATESPNLTSGGSTNSAPRGPGLSEGKGHQVIILENNLSVPAQKLCHAKQEALPATTVDPGNSDVSSPGMGEPGVINGRKPEKVEEAEDAEEEDQEDEEAPKENPFFKLRSSTNLVEQDIREAQKREKELRKQRISLYGGKGSTKGGGDGGRRASTEGQSPAVSSPSPTGLTVPDLPGTPPRRGSGPSAALQTPGKLGMWPPAHPEEEGATQREVLRSPQTPRQKTPLVQRWESGLVNGHSEEDE